MEGMTRKLESLYNLYVKNNWFQTKKKTKSIKYFEEKTVNAYLYKRDDSHRYKIAYTQNGSEVQLSKFKGAKICNK